MNGFWKIFYNLILIPASVPPLLVIALFNKKLRSSFPERFSAAERLEAKLMNRGRSKVIWFHLASSGEFLMTKPLVEKLRQNLKDVGSTFVYTFTSPSGIEWLQKNNPEEIFGYYPFDDPFHVDKLIQSISPSALLLIKYDTWPNLIWLCRKYNIPVFLVSALIKDGSAKISNPLFRSFFKSIYSEIPFILPTDKPSKSKFSNLLADMKSVKFSGEIKIDSALLRKEEAKTKEKSKELQNLFERLKNDYSHIILGASTWQTEQEWLVRSFARLTENKKTQKKFLLILAPHDPDEKHLEEIEHLCENNSLACVRLSKASKSKQFDVVLIDTIGVLMEFFSLAHFAMVGVGKGGVHNFLEPMVWQVPVTFRTAAWKDTFAEELVKKKWITPVADEQQLFELIEKMFANSQERKNFAKGALQFIVDNAGTTERIADVVVKELGIKSAQK